MIFQKKMDRAMDWLKEQNTDSKDTDEDKSLSKDLYSVDDQGSEDKETTYVGESKENMVYEDSTNESLEEKDDLKKQNHVNTELEKHDMTALMLSAFLVLFPVALVILGIFVLIAWLFI